MKSKKPDKLKKTKQGADAEHLPVFDSVHKAWQELKRAGYKIGKTKMYEDAIKGAFAVNKKDGSVLETEIKAYAATLQRREANLDDLNDVHTRRAERDVVLQDIKIKKLEFELEKEQGKWLPRVEFESELAARAVIFDSSFDHLIDVNAREWIAIVGGKTDRIADFIAELKKAKDRCLSEFSTTNVFQVLFEDEG